jgi:collagenase-like PrtC family protease
MAVTPKSKEGGTASAPPELLAPAGDWSSLEAALDAGADAVYFGSRVLNARRRARNFSPDEMAKAVKLIHARDARAYLTLNIDVAERELRLAAKVLVWARQCGVDAVLVKDPALLALRTCFPEVEFHFSTQSCITNSADVEAAKALGIQRVVLAREMTLTEILASSSVPPVETEVFVQGALCFSVSGRCHLSSWVGGHSGNRGTCTSPCRVPWSGGAVVDETPFSMRDLSTPHRVDELRGAGVRALKIEGRMKNTAWVRNAVELYRRAIDGEEGTQLLDEAQQLGAYTGRQLTSGYLDGKRDELTGSAGREAMHGAEMDPSVRPQEPVSDLGGPTYDLTVQIGSEGVRCECTCLGRTEQWSMPRTVVRRKHKAVSVGDLLQWLTHETLQGCRPQQLVTDDPDFLLVPRAANHLVDRIRAAVQRARKRAGELDGVELPEKMLAVLRKGELSGANRLRLGDTPDRVRIDISELERFRRRCRPGGFLVEGVTENSLAKLRKAAGKVQCVVALPSVFFEAEIPGLKRLLTNCKRAGTPVEVNSWGAWRLATAAGVRMEGGPGLPVLNSLAARQLAESGLRSVTSSMEADRRKLQDLTAQCPVACSLTVFGRPPLWISRVKLPDESFHETVLQDRRRVRIKGRRERGLWVFRPVEPFDLRDVHNERIQVAHLVVDLVGSNDPVADFQSVGAAHEPFRFNYDRSLV